MRLLRSLICACAAASVIALKDEDPIILFGSQSRQSSGSKIPSLSPTAARLVLAKQLGLDQYHSLRDVDQETIDALNSHGSRWSGLLEESEKNHPRTLLYLDGLEITQSIWTTCIAQGKFLRINAHHLFMQILSKNTHQRLRFPVLQAQTPAGASLKTS